MSNVTASKSVQHTQKTGSKFRAWTPRFWHGMSTPGWFNLLARNRFAIAPTRWAMATIISLFAPLNAVFSLLQRARFGRRIARTDLADDPIFVIGHWRSGTTYLHELLVRDFRFTYPNTYDVFAPNHFLVSGPVIKPWVKYLLPATRPMDNVAAGWERPQEDEFALCCLGLRSPYLTIAFPNRPQDADYLDLAGISGEALAQWKQRFLWFLKCLTIRTPKRIVLKSPPHTARVRVLLDMFPRARFIHIVRDPYVLFPSTINLWSALYRDHGLQSPRFEGFEEMVFDSFCRMYEAFERDRSLIPAGQLADVRYEDLVADPLGELERVYRELDLGSFDAARPALEPFVGQQREYKTNRYAIAPELRREISQRWGFYFDRYGYTREQSD